MEGHRLAGLDAFKGALMIVMALDHAKHAFARVGGQDPVPSEYFNVLADYDGLFGWWFVRFITNVVPCGFAFSMGIGVRVFINSRKQKGWSVGQILKHFALRGLFLVVIEQVITQFRILTNLLRGLQTPYIFLGGILFMLGNNIFVSAVVLSLKDALGDRLGRFVSFLIPILCVVIMTGSFCFVKFASFNVNGSIWTWWIIPVRHSLFGVQDCWVPWLPVVLLGEIMYDVKLHNKILLLLAGSMALGFGLMRLLFVLNLTNLGNFRPILNSSFCSVFGLSKYPPSPAYILLWVSVDVAILLVFLNVSDEGKVFKCLEKLGKGALFFYLFHLFVYSWWSIPFEVNFSTNLPGIIFIWVTGLLLCVFPTIMFGEFKARTSLDSWWRLF